MSERLHGEYKVPGGKLVAVDLAVVDDHLADVRVSGDFFLNPDEALEVIDRALAGLHAATPPAELAARIDDDLTRAGADGLISLPVTMVGFDTHAIAMAVRRALGRSTSWADHTFTYLDPGRPGTRRACRARRGALAGAGGGSAWADPEVLAVGEPRP